MKVLLVLLLSVGAFALRIPTLNWRIVQREPAKEGQFPYQIALRSFGKHSCGGSIITPTTILSAAHCVDGASSSSLTVVAGIIELNGQGDSYKVKSSTLHQDYDGLDSVNDISLIHLASSIQYNERVNAIRVGSTIVGSGAKLVVSGWAESYYPGSFADKLQFINLLSISNTECAQQHLATGIPITDRRICTWTAVGKKGACQGDSGGPVVSGVEQVGIVSWGRSCHPKFPDVFNRVSYYAQWINQNQ